MSIQAVAWALEQDLPQGPKLVLVSLANHANNVDGYCWLKAETVAREASCSPRSVWRYVGGLVRNGYVRKVPRKGDNGKQRANDYWLLFNRPATEWDWGMQLDEDGSDPSHDEADTVEGETQDVAEPTANLAHGETATPDDTAGTRQPVENPVVSHGPCANGVSRKRIAEPSKPNPKASSAGARDGSAAPRAYRPPPPQPLGADLAQPTKQIFVYAGSRAYEAWAKRKARESGIRQWTLTTSALVDGKWCSGWYFPTLFPPDDEPKPATGPPHSSAA